MDFRYFKDFLGKVSIIQWSRIEKRGATMIGLTLSLLEQEKL